MKKIITVCTLMFATVAIVAQTQNVDSLLKVLNTQQLTPDKQLALYLEICNIYEGNDTEKHMKYADKGLELAEKEKNRGMALIFIIAKIYAYTMKSDYDNAIIYCKKGLELAKKEKNKIEEAKIYMNLGIIYARQDDFETGMEYLWKALPIAESSGNKKLYSTILSNIGAFYRSMQNTEQAIYYLEQAKTIDEELDFSLGLITIYYDLGSIYRDQKELEKALEYQLKALNLSRTVPDKESEVYVNQALALIYMDLKDYGNAEECANECLRLAKEFGDPRQLLGAWNALSNIYLAQNRYQECEDAALMAWNADSANLDLGRNVTFNIAKANIFLGNKEKMNYFFDKYDEIIKKYTDESFRENLTTMEIKYKTEKKEMRISALEKEKKFYIGFGISGATILLLIIVLLLVRHRLNLQKRKLAEQQREIAEQQVMQLEKEKQLVATQALLDGETTERSRLARDLHDGLGGMLSVVKLNLKDMKSYSIMDGPDVSRFDKALKMLDESINELRRVAHHMMPESLMRYGLKVSLEDFCRAIPGAHFQYLGIENRLEDHLEVALYRCTYELVNNAVKYAKATAINVQLMIDSGVVALTIQDNGIGFDPEAGTSGSGLENIRTRVSAYHGKMNIYSSPGRGTEVSIEIEYN